MSKTDSEPSRRPAKRKTSWRVNVLVMLMVTIFTLACVEVVLRLTWHNSYGTESPEHFLKLGLQPALRDRLVKRDQLDEEHPVVQFRTDDRNYILPSFQYEDPDATIAFLGGSTTQCAPVQESLRFPAAVSELLREKNWKVNALNAARSGNTLQHSLNILVNHVIHDHPDIVVVMHATNDIGLLARAGDYRPLEARSQSSGDVLLWCKQMLTRHCYVAALARSCFVAQPAPEDDVAFPWRNDPAKAGDVSIDGFRRRLRAFIHLCRDFDIRPVLMTQPLSGATNELTPDWADMGAQERFNEVIREVGKEEGAVVIDLDLHLRRDIPDWDEPMNIFYDGMHVTDHGSQVYAAYIAEKLLPLVEEVAGKKTAPSMPAAAEGSRDAGPAKRG